MFKKLKEDFKLVKRGLKIISMLEPYMMTLKIIIVLFNAFTPFIYIYIPGMILNELAGNKDLKTLTILVLVLVGTPCITGIIGYSLSRIAAKKDFSFSQKYMMHISEKILSMDYDDVEDPEIPMKKLKIIQNSALKRITHFVESIISSSFRIFISTAITWNVFICFSDNNYSGFLGFVNSYMFSIIMVLIIIGNVVFTMYATDANIKKTYKIRQGFVRFNRFFYYYIYEYAGTYKAGKDIRLYNQKNFLAKETMKHFYDVHPTITALSKNDIFYQNLNTITTVVMSGTIYTFVGLKSLLGIFEVGSIVQYVGSVGAFIGAFSGFMSSITSLRSNNQALSEYFEFMDLPNKMHKGTLPIEKRDDNEYEIEFKNVSFKYPGTDAYVLKNLSLKFRIGQRLAVVGMNGSGKTTMIKLLCRLYEPTDGEITLNGFNINKYDYKEYTSIFSVVFQDFKLFSFSLGQNVAASVEYDDEKVIRYLNESGLGERYAKMEHGLETSLYKDFDESGVEISGGEAQKIALARALYKDAPFIVLDEPTAALDPIAEFEIYSKFNEIVGDKTAIYISHRLSSCRFCDDIAVFHDGELIQRGSHDELIADVSGKYHELWNAQAQYYAENNTNILKA